MSHSVLSSGYQFLKDAIGTNPIVCSFLQQKQEITCCAHKDPNQVFLADVSTSNFECISSHQSQSFVSRVACREATLRISQSLLCCGNPAYPPAACFALLFTLPFCFSRGCNRIIAVDSDDTRTQDSLDRMMALALEVTHRSLFIATIKHYAIRKHTLRTASSRRMA